ncbi:MAG: phosphoenolpyruvate carboxykinase, partial [Treponema sp.]|nr:phosphoenolpyruvate carboxykinase [Treponema sp.]
MNVNEVKHAGLKKWIDEAAALMTPDSIEICDGGKAEYDRMIQITLDAGLATPLAARPNCYLYRSDPSDVARVENRTYIA